MQAHIALGPLPIGFCFGGLRALPCFWRPSRRQRVVRAPLLIFASSHSQNHYSVLGIPPSSTAADIKKAYRLLSLKWHPDICKDSQANEVFKSIRLAYDVLSNEATRLQYDKSVKVVPPKDDFGSYPESSFEYNEVDYPGPVIYVSRGISIVYGRDYLRNQRQRKQRGKHHKHRSGKYSSFRRVETESESKVADKSLLSKVIAFSLLFLLLVSILGCPIPLALNSLVSLLDQELDIGNKVGYFVAWSLGDKVGVWLTLFVSFANCALGKDGSRMAVAVVVAMWVCSTLPSYFPIPRGAVLALLHMSMKQSSK